jgi:hypothetical protein
MEIIEIGAFGSFALLVVAWLVAPSRSKIVAIKSVKKAA